MIFPFFFLNKLDLVQDGDMMILHVQTKNLNNKFLK